MRKLHDLGSLKLAAVIIVIAFVCINLNQCGSDSELPEDKQYEEEEEETVTCNYNGMCERGEYDFDLEHENQPCEDCVLKDYSPLQLVPDPGLQIVGSNAIIGKVFQFKFENYQYMDTWASNKIEKPEEADYLYPHPDIGDIDQDGEKEIVAVVNYKYLTEPLFSFDQKIFVYENGSKGIPSYEGERFGYPTSLRYIELGDVNNDGDDELILDKGLWVEIYNWNSSGFERVWHSPEYNNTIFRVDIGNADNDPENEVVFAMFEINAPIIWEFDSNFKGLETVAEPIDVLHPDLDFLGIDHARPRDADNDGLPEIIAGGNNNRLMVWKYLWDEDFGTYRYKSVFISEDLVEFTPGIDTGDVDGDGDNEVIVGTAAMGPSILYIFDLVLVDPYKYTYRLGLVDSMEIFPGAGELSVGDVDSDGKAEIIVRGMRIFEYIGGQLYETYSSIYGEHAKVK